MPQFYQEGPERSGFNFGQQSPVTPQQNPLAGDLNTLQSVVNRDGEEGAVNEARDRSALQSDNNQAQFERATRGMDLSDRQKKVSGRRLGLRRTLNRASAVGDTRRGFTDRSEQAASQGQGFADALFNQNMSGETSIVQANQIKKNAATRKAASDKASKRSLLGTALGIGAMMFMSSEKIKHNHGHEGDLLEKLKKVRVNRWQYKGDDKTHVGPFSEEFNREFQIDTEFPDRINVIDALGVTMGAIKELDKKVSAHGSR